MVDRRPMFKTAKIHIYCLLTVLACLPATASAEGSILWKEVKEHISESDATLVLILEKKFIMDDHGWAIRMGSHQGELGGMRIQPYTFEATHKKSKKRYSLEINTCPDYEFTNRWCFEYRILSGTQPLNPPRPAR